MIVLKRSVIILCVALLLCSFCACSNNSESKKAIEPVPKTVWFQGEFLDGFGDPTGEEYIYSDVMGTFSNTATNNSDLLASVLVEPDYVSIALREYGDLQVTNSYSHNVDYEISMKDANGQKSELSGYMIMYVGDRVVINDEYRESVLDALKGNGTVSFYLVNTEMPTSKYRFSVETGNFAKLYKDMGF